MVSGAYFRPISHARPLRFMALNAAVKFRPVSHPLLSPPSPQRMYVQAPRSRDEYRTKINSILTWYRRAAFPYEDRKQTRDSRIRRGEILIEKAYKFARDAHKNVLRKSGEPYISHPIALAEKIKELNLPDAEKVAAALLHDVVEDNPEITIEGIRREFGSEVAVIVDGLTKLENEDKVKTYEKIIQYMNIDPRIALLKLLDVVHNLETISHMREHFRRRFAESALEIYAPIADGLGMREIKNRIEDMAFAVLSPSEFIDEAQGAGRRRSLRDDERRILWHHICSRYKKHFSNDELPHFALTGWDVYETHVIREKRKISFSADAIEGEAAFAVVVPNHLDPFLVFSKLFGNGSKKYFMIADPAIKDLVNNPKPNGYQALIFRVVGPQGTLFNIQIQTQHQHNVGIFGLAHDIRHRLFGERKLRDAQSGKMWRASLHDSLEGAEIEDSRTLAHEISGQVSAVVLYDKDRRPYNLPPDTTFRDFAFRLGTNIGLRAYEATVGNAQTITDLATQVASAAGQQIVFALRNRLPPYEMLDETTIPAYRRRIVEARKFVPLACIATGREVLAKELIPHCLTVEDVLAVQMINAALGPGDPLPHLKIRSSLDSHPLYKIVYGLYDRLNQIAREKTGVPAQFKEGLVPPNYILFLLGSGVISPDAVYSAFEEARNRLIAKNAHHLEIMLAFRRRCEDELFKTTDVDRKTTLQKAISLRQWPKVYIVVETDNRRLAAVFISSHLGRLGIEYDLLRSKQDPQKLTVAADPQNRLEEVQIKNICGRCGGITLHERIGDGKAIDFLY